MIDFKRDELEKMALEIGNTRFQIKDAPFPFCLLWFQIDRVDLGRLMLKVAEAPKILPDGNILTQEKLPERFRIEKPSDIPFADPGDFEEFEPPEWLRPFMGERK